MLIMETQATGTGGKYPLFLVEVSAKIGKLVGLTIVPWAAGISSEEMSPAMTARSRRSSWRVCNGFGRFGQNRPYGMAAGTLMGRSRGLPLRTGPWRRVRARRG